MSRKAVIIIFLTIDQCTGHWAGAGGRSAWLLLKHGLVSPVSELGAIFPRLARPALARPLTRSRRGEQNDSINDEIINYYTRHKSDAG